jgi:phosphoglycerate dehydrogenase-like enzyme
MKALFLGHFAATFAPRILAKIKTLLEGSSLDDQGGIAHLASGTSSRSPIVIMTMLVLTHRLFEAVGTFRAGSWSASPQFGDGFSHGEVMGRTIGIIGYGRSGSGEARG